MEVRSYRPTPPPHVGDGAVLPATGELGGDVLRGAYPNSIDDYDVVHPALLTPPDYPISGFSRTEAGLVLDRQLVKLAGMDARCRLVQARLTRRLMESRAWRPLGFVRLSDYARERLGCSSRLLEDDSRVLKALDELPKLRAALERADVSWTQARLLVRIATPDDEAALLEHATTLGARGLEAFVRERRSKPDAATEQNRAAASDNEGTGAASNEYLSTREARTGSRDGAAPLAASDDANCDEQTGELLVRWNTSVSQTGRRLWRCASEIAGRMAGRRLPAAEVLELVVAEAASGEPIGADDPSGWRPGADAIEARLLAGRRRDEDRERRMLEAFRAEAGVVEGFDWLDPARRLAGPAERLDSLVDSLDAADAHEIDRRLREVRRVAQRIDYQLGALLRIGSDRRLFREIGFATVKLYVESRLGCSARRVWSLLAIERETWRRSAALRTAWREGRISHLAACTLLPVIDDVHGEAWIRRAGEVTLRRLADEVAWALDHGEREDCRSNPAPPPHGTAVPPGGLSSVDLHEVQMRAHGESARDEFGAPGGARLAFHVPLSLAALLETQVLRYRHRGDASWRTFERIVSHALLEWTSGPKHRDPVFERDGWRCAVPACSSRCNLHDHHVVFRSQGGDGARENRVTVCAAHHLHGIHEGIITAEGKAPDRLKWAMGCRPDGEPLMRFHGERYADCADLRATLH